MVSAESTVITFFIPDTVRLAQWPVITIVLLIPLTVTALSLHAIVLFSSIPETSSGAPGAAVAEVGGLALLVPGVLVDDLGLRVVVRGAVLSGAVVGVVSSEEMIDRTPEIWCAANAAMIPAMASTVITMMVPTIHHTRLIDDGLCTGPAYGAPP